MRKEDSDPRTLIINANSLSTQTNNGKMVASFFRHYPIESLAQFYTWPEYPDSSQCDTYYRITDEEMLRSWLGQTPGSVVERKTTQIDVTMSAIYNKSIKSFPIMRLGRDLAWSKHTWKTNVFLHWLDAFSPEIVFFAGINNLALYRIAEFVSQRFEAPIIVYITDDYFLPRFSLSPFFHIRRRWLECSMRRLLMRKHTSLLTVNRYMTETYRGFFGKDGEEIFNAVKISGAVPKQAVSGEPILISYIGNLLNNRTSTLRKLCSLLKRYPNKSLFRFQIFAREIISKRELQKLSMPPTVVLCGALDSVGVAFHLQNSDVLMHIESFHYPNRRDTLLSLSTKLMEYMAAARPILMIGPPDVGSVRFMKETNNVVVDSLNSGILYEALDKLRDEAFRARVSAENASTALSFLQRSNSEFLVRAVSLRMLAEKRQDRCT